MPSDDELIAAWHGQLVGTLLAHELGLELKDIYAQWRRLRREGRIPRGDRPINHTHRDASYEHLFDGRPVIADEDPLLAALLAGRR